MIADSYKRAPHFTTMVVMAMFLFSGIAFAQNSSGAIQADTPDGYSNSGGQARRVFNRRFAKTQERNRIEISIQEYAAESVEVFLKAQLQSKETEIPGSMRPLEIAGRAGQSMDFKGTYEFRGKTFNTKRSVAAFWLSKGVFLRFSSLLVFPKATPSDRLVAASKGARRSLVNNIKLTVDGNSASVAIEVPKSNPETAPPTDKTKTYSNLSTIPFSFEYPAHWYVGTEDVQAPGSLWVIATPFSEQAVYAPLDQLEAALRVNVIGFLPELFGVTDGLGLAARIARQRFENNKDYAVSIEKSGLLGSANGQLIRYTPKRGKTGIAGQILVVSVDSSLLIAEFSWPSEENARYEQQSLEILTSFKIEFDRGVEVVKKDGISFEYSPSLWTFEEVGTSDRSHAWSLTSNKTELFLRSILLDKGTKIDAATLRKTCELLLGRELQLASAEVLVDAATFRLPRADSTWRCFFFHKNKAKEAYAMVRDGALHLAVLTTDNGVRGFNVAQALTIFAKIKGPKFAGKAQLTGKQLLEGTCRFTSIRAEAFEIDGTFTGQLRTNLDLGPNGKVRISPMTSETGASIGTYVIDAKGLSATFEGRPTMRLSWTTNGRGLRGDDGRLWHISTDM